MSTQFMKNYFAAYHGLPRLCWQGIFASFVESTLAGVYYFLSIYFVDVLHMSVSTAGILISFYGLGTIAGGIIGGKLSDKVSPSIVLTLSLMIQAASFLCLIKLRTIQLIAFNLLILGVATYGFITSNYTWVLSHCKNSEIDRLKAINILSVASNLGIGLSAIIISVLVNHGFHYIFNLSGVLLFALAIFLVLQNSHVSVDKTITEVEKPIPIASKEKKGIVYLALICLFFTGMIVSQLSTTYSIYLKEAFPQWGVHAFSILFFLSTCLIDSKGKELSSQAGA